MRYCTTLLNLKYWVNTPKLYSAKEVMYFNRIQSDAVDKDLIQVYSTYFQLYKYFSIYSN